MKPSLSPRLRAPALLAVLSVIPLAIGAATYGWSSLADIVPVVLVVIAALYLWSGRDTDTGALLRREPDERQIHQRLQVQALVGRVLSGAVALAYLIAVAANATLWPWAAMLGVVLVAFVAGRVLYGEHATH